LIFLCLAITALFPDRNRHHDECFRALLSRQKQKP
jgi:hypothetical protein